MSFLSVTVSVLTLSVVNTLLLPVTGLVPDWYKWKLVAVLPDALFIAVNCPAPTIALKVTVESAGVCLGDSTQIIELPVVVSGTCLNSSSNVEPPHHVPA